MKRIWMVSTLILCLTAIVFFNGCKDEKEAVSSLPPTQPTQLSLIHI